MIVYGYVSWFATYLTWSSERVWGSLSWIVAAIREVSTVGVASVPNSYAEGTSEVGCVIVTTRSLISGAWIGCNKGFTLNIVSTVELWDPSLSCCMISL